MFGDDFEPSEHSPLSTRKGGSAEAVDLAIEAFTFTREERYSQRQSR